MIGISRADLIASLRDFVEQLEDGDVVECYLELKTVKEKSVVIQCTEDQVIVDVVDEQRN